MIKKYNQYLNESNDNNTGRKVKIKDDSRHKEDAYSNNGDGYGTIMKYDGKLYHISWNNNIRWFYEMKEFDFVDEIEDDKPVKIRWYKKGKLEENKLFENKENIGKKVKIKKGVVVEIEAYGEAHGKKGDGYGIIKDYRGELKFPYVIKWNNGYTGDYDIKEFDFVDEIENDEPTRIRWYKKGKLEENKLFENENNVGRKVKIKDESAGYKNAYKDGGDGYGIIKKYNIKYDIYTIEWNSRHIGFYRADVDFEFVDEIEDDKPHRIRWYKKGKLED